MLTIRTGIVPYLALAFVGIVGKSYGNRRVSAHFKWKSYGNRRVPHTLSGNRTEIVGYPYTLSGIRSEPV